MEQIAALRAEWLAQLAQAIEGAQRLAWQLGTREATSAEARDLYSRLEAAKMELQSIQGLARTRLYEQLVDLDWLEKLGWTSQPEPDV